jgi:hypothetical protein
VRSREFADAKPADQRHDRGIQKPRHEPERDPLRSKSDEAELLL